METAAPLDVPFPLERRATRWELPELSQAFIMSRRGSIYSKRNLSSPPDVRSDNSPELYGFGWNDDGQLGTSDAVDRTTPELINLDAQFEGKKIVQLACGKVTSMALTDDGSIFVWGENVDGRLALGHRKKECRPVLLARSSELGKTISQIACGAEHFVAVATDGSVLIWGSPRCDNFGVSRALVDVLPMPIVLGDLALHGKQIQSVVCGYKHTIALTTEGEMIVWGERRYGVLGTGDNYEICEERHSVQETPVLIPKERIHNKTIVQVAAGEHHSLARTSDGMILAWGSNLHGELGIGHREICYESHPALIPSEAVFGKKIVDIGCGRNFSVAVTEDGCVLAWGDNHVGQLGLGKIGSTHLSSNSRSILLSPAQIPRENFLGLRVAKVHCGGTHVIAETTQGKLLIWGRNVEGFLGLGHSNDQSTPALITTFYSRKVLAVASGHAHTLVLVAPCTPMSPSIGSP